MTKLERIKKVMQKYELDALIASTPENVGYVSGYFSPFQINYRSQVYAVVFGEEALGVCLILPAVKLATSAQRSLPIKDIETFGAFFIEAPRGKVELAAVSQRLADTLATVRPKANALEALEGVLRAKGLAAGRLGIDEMRVDPSVLDRLRSDFDRAEVIQAYDIFQEIQAVKTREEVGLLKEACDITMRAVEETLEAASDHVAQKRLVEICRISLIRQGVPPSHTIFRCGQEGAIPEAFPSDYRLQEGDLVAWDVGCEVEGYHSDLAGTAVVGRPDAKQVRYYQAVLAGQRAVLDAIKPGARMADAFHAGVETVRENGIPHYKRNHCGHGIGVEGYGLPLITPDSPFVFEVGMVVCVEAPYYEIGFGSLIVEDTVLVTESGFEYLSTIERELRVL